MVETLLLPAESIARQLENLEARLLCSTRHVVAYSVLEGWVLHSVLDFMATEATVPFEAATRGTSDTMR